MEEKTSQTFEKAEFLPRTCRAKAGKPLIWCLKSGTRKDKPMMLLWLFS